MDLQTAPAIAKGTVIGTVDSGVRMSEPVPKSPDRNTPGNRFLANLAYLVPGYHGYKQKGLRQDEDARLRSRVLARLHELEMLLDERKAQLTELSLDAAGEEMDKRVSKLDRLAKAVRFAPYGFVGFFEAESVGEETLERILETDLLLFQDLDDAVEYLRGTPFPPANRSAFSAFFETIDTDIERVERRLITRDKLLGNC